MCDVNCFKLDRFVGNSSQCEGAWHFRIDTDGIRNAIWHGFFVVKQLLLNVILATIHEFLRFHHLLHKLIHRVNEPERRRGKNATCQKSWKKTGRARRRESEPCADFIQILKAVTLDNKVPPRDSSLGLFVSRTSMCAMISSFPASSTL